MRKSSLLLSMVMVSPWAVVSSTLLSSLLLSPSARSLCTQGQGSHGHDLTCSVTIARFRIFLLLFLFTTFLLSGILPTQDVLLGLLV